MFFISKSVGTLNNLLYFDDVYMHKASKPVVPPPKWVEGDSCHRGQAEPVSQQPGHQSCACTHQGSASQHPAPALTHEHLASLQLSVQPDTRCTA